MRGGDREMSFLFRAFNFFVWLCWVCAIICIFCLAFAVFLFLFQPRQGQFFGGLVGILFQCSCGGERANDDGASQRLTRKFGRSRGGGGAYSCYIDTHGRSVQGPGA